MKRITGALCAIFTSAARSLRSLTLCIVHCALCIGLAATASATIDLNAIKPDGFAKGVVFTVDGYAANEDRATLTNFPVLVRLSPTAISGFVYADSLVSDGGDIRFADENGAAIPFEKDTWNSSGESLFWVTLPEMTNGTQFAMFYGASASAANAVAVVRPWSEYVGVWHLNETGQGAVSISDSTANALHGTAGSNKLNPQYMAGPVGNGRRIYDGDAKVKQGIIVNLNSQAKINAVYGLGTDFTASFWVYRSGVLQWHYLISAMNGDAYGSWGVQSHDDKAQDGWYPEQMRVWANNKDNKASDRAGISARLTDFASNSGWHKMDVVWKYTTNNNIPSFQLYWDGELTTNVRDIPAAYGPVNHKNTYIAIGGETSGGSRPFSGYMDEVRLRAFVPTVDWIRADYDTVNDASFLSASSATEFTVRPAPVVDADAIDVGAAFIQLSGEVTACGGAATAVDIYAKAWPVGDAEPSVWTNLATGVPLNGSFGGFITGLTPKTEYNWAVKGVNNLATPEDSDPVTDTVETSGVGEAGGGGTVERQRDDLVHTFQPVPGVTATYTFTPPDGVTEVEALVVAGGGPGGYYAGGGGGGGGLIYTNDLAVTPLATYTIKVGKGGAASANVASYGANGDNSSVIGADVNLVAIGGGAGGNGALNNQTATGAGLDGGSGGGGHTSAGHGTSGQGNDGGTHGDTPAYGGGGGGADGVGTTIAWGVSAVKGGGPGGDGRQISISGNSVSYAGGGGGGGPKSQNGSAYGNGGSGGRGGGGMGGQETGSADTAVAEDGEDGLGGGGGGGSTYSLETYKGGDGGSGIVIIRYGAGGDGVGATAPIISLHRASYDGTEHKANLAFRVAWAGENYDFANVKAIWGYTASRLIYTNDVASAVIGASSGSFAPRGDNRTIYCKVIAVNGAGAVGVSAETLSFFVEDDGLLEPVVAPALGAVAMKRIDGLYAVVTGSLVSAGSSATATVRLMVGPSAEAMAERASVTIGAGAFELAVTGLATNTAYWYAIEAEDDAGLADETVPAPFTTVGASSLPTPATSVRQSALTVSGNLTIGAGTTYILTKVGDGDWEVAATYSTESADNSFAVSLQGSWDSILTGYLMCSNTCELIDGTLVGEPFVSAVQEFQIVPVDYATYTWQPVNGDWDGEWTDAAHWDSSEDDCPGYPRMSETTASFTNCTAANPVVVTVNGNFTVKNVYCFGRLASDVTFAGTNRASCGFTAKFPAHNSPERVTSNTRVEFRDMTVGFAADWDVMLNKADVTNITVRLDNVSAAANVTFSLCAPYSRFEFAGGTTVSCKKIWIGGTDMECLIDDSTIILAENFWSPAGMNNGNDGLAVRFKGASPRIIVTSGGDSGVRPDKNTGGTVLFSFDVPAEGYALPPISLRGKLAKGSSNNESTPKFKFEVDYNSPALRETSKPLDNVVLVDTENGIYMDNMYPGIGDALVHHGSPCGSFTYGVNGEPLADGQDVADARQILLSLQGWGNSPTMLIMR